MHACERPKSIFIHRHAARSLAYDATKLYAHGSQLRLQVIVTRLKKRRRTYILQKKKRHADLAMLRKAWHMMLTIGS